MPSLPTSVSRFGTFHLTAARHIGYVIWLTSGNPGEAT